MGFNSGFKGLMPLDTCIIFTSNHLHVHLNIIS